MRRTLKGIKRYPEIKERFAGKMVRIWSGEHKLWWLLAGSGYSSAIEEAGVYLFEDAWKRSSHCGPEKKISYEIVTKAGILAERNN